MRCVLSGVAILTLTLGPLLVANAQEATQQGVGLDVVRDAIPAEDGAGVDDIAYLAAEAPDTTGGHRGGQTPSGRGANSRPDRPNGPGAAPDGPPASPPAGTATSAPATPAPARGAPLVLLSTGGQSGAPSGAPSAGAAPRTAAPDAGAAATSVGAAPRPTPAGGAPDRAPVNEPAVPVPQQSPTVLLTTPPTTPAPPGAPTVSGAPIGFLLREAASRMRDDLSRVRVQVYEPAIWSDASLGCSSLAGMVDQVAAPGFRVMIQAGGYALDYRVDEARNRVLLCEVIALEPPKP